VSTVTLAKWAKMPGFPGRKGNGPGGGNGHYDIEEIRAWRGSEGEFSKPVNGGGRGIGGGAGDRGAEMTGADYKREADRLRLNQLRATSGIAELEFEERAGRILDRERTEGLNQRIASVVIAMLEEIPDRADAQLPTQLPVTVLEIRELNRRIIQDVIREVQTHISEMVLALSVDEDDADDREETGDV